MTSARRLFPSTVSRLLFVAGLCAAGASAQTAPSDTSQSDRIERKIDDIHRDVRVIREEAIESPLGDRKWGVEFNPARLLLSNSDRFTLSGGVSNFSWNRSAEVAFPFVYWSADDGDDRSTVFSQDVHYRHFLSGRQRGFYVGGYARYQFADYSLLDFSSDRERETAHRGGLAFEIGGRVFSRSGVYWGWSVSLGRYFVGDLLEERSGVPSNPALWAGDYIFDAELLKIGFAF